MPPATTLKPRRPVNSAKFGSSIGRRLAFALAAATRCPTTRRRRHFAADPRRLEQHVEAQRATRSSLLKLSFTAQRPGRFDFCEDVDRAALLGDGGLAVRQRHHVGIEARHRLGIDPGVRQEVARPAVRAADRVAPARVVEGGRCRSSPSGPDFLALEDDVGHREHHDHAGDQAGELRPDQDQALVERQRRARDRPAHLHRQHEAQACASRD